MRASDVSQPLDAVVVGAGHNGLVAATMLARAGKNVLVVEAAETPGGGVRTEALTLEGFRHDVCAAVHPLAVASPAFSALSLTDYGLEWRHPEVVLAHPLNAPDGHGAHLTHDLTETAKALGSDGAAYERLVGSLVEHWDDLATALLAPPARWLDAARALVGRGGLRWRDLCGAAATFGAPAGLLARSLFNGAEARALIGGCAAHAFLPLSAPGTGGMALTLLALAHRNGWPFAAGGSGAITDALVAAFVDAGGRLECARRASSLDDLPHATTTLLNLTRANAARLIGATDWKRLVRRGPGAAEVARRLRRSAPASKVVKIDYALDGPIRWTYRPARRAGTVHLGGTLEEIAAVEHGCADAQHAPPVGSLPFTLVTQPSTVDASRAPAGKHIAWVYAHLPYRHPHDQVLVGPSGSSVSWSQLTWSGSVSGAQLAELVEAQIERFAPGFSDLVLARHVKSPGEVEAANANFPAGDITGGSLGVAGLAFRPRFAKNPYRLAPGLYMCGASTPPGPGVHGMSGYHAAAAMLRGELAS